MIFKRYTCYQRKNVFVQNMINNPIESELKTVVPRANNLNLNLKFKTYFRFNFFNRVKRLAFKKQVKFFYDWYFSKDNNFSLKLEAGKIYFLYKKNIYENLKYYNFVVFLCKRWFVNIEKKNE
jgi:hypothetical protein